jgi:hypothetical protein
MVNNNQWPFENAGREFYVAMPQELVDPMEDMLHHVKPGLSILVACFIRYHTSVLKSYSKAGISISVLIFIGTSMD